MFKKKKTYIVLVLIIAVIGGFFYFKNKKPKTTYVTEGIERGDLARTVSPTGTARLQDEADLSFKTAGKIEQYYVNLGDKVKKGQLLVRIDRAVLNLELRQAEEEIRAQKKNLANMKMRKSTYNKFQEDAQRAEIKKYEAAAAAVKQQLFETNIYAPFDGIVLKKNFEAGENTAANSAVLTIGNGELEIESNVPESDIVKVSVGQKATLAFDAFSMEEKFEAEVVEIEPAATVIQDVVYYKVKLKMASQDSRLKTGMSCDIDINTAEAKNVVMAPLRAIKTEGDKKYVEVLKDEKNNLTEKVYITTGLEGDDGMVEVKSGLNGGEKVITLTK